MLHGHLVPYVRRLMSVLESERPTFCLRASQTTDLCPPPSVSSASAGVPSKRAQRYDRQLRYVSRVNPVSGVSPPLGHVCWISTLLPCEHSLVHSLPDRPIA